MKTKSIKNAIKAMFQGACFDLNVCYRAKPPLPTSLINPHFGGSGNLMTKRCEKTY